MAEKPHTQDSSVFTQEFDADTQRELADEDSFAWRSVTGLLIAIISVGLLIAIVAVTLAS